nr:Uncharacterised protein [Klebsiella pneumoniae]
MDFIFQHEQYLREFDLIHSGCYSYMETHLPQLRELNIPVSFDFQMTLYWSRRCRCAVTSTSPSSHAPTTARRKHVKLCNKRRPAEVALSARRVEMKARFYLTGRIGISRRPITSLPSIQWVQVMLLLPLSFAIFWPNLRVTSAKRLPRACKSSSFLGTNLPERRGIWLRDSLLTYNAISHFSVLISVR